MTTPTYEPDSMAACPLCGYLVPYCDGDARALPRVCFACHTPRVQWAVACYCTGCGADAWVPLAGYLADTHRPPCECDPDAVSCVTTLRLPAGPAPGQRNVGWVP